MLESTGPPGRVAGSRQDLFHILAKTVQTFRLDNCVLVPSSGEF